MAPTPQPVRLTRNDVPRVQDFLRSVYGPACYGAADSYFRWLYLESPCRWFAPEAAEGQIPVNALLKEDGGLGAIHAFLPFDARTPWGGGRGVWDVEWINASGIRGGGRILATHLLEGVDVYAGYGCNELSETAFRRMGLEIVPEIPRWVLVLDAAGLGRELEALAETPDGFRVPETKLPRFGAWHELSAAAAISDGVLSAYAEATPFGVSRSVEWLQWRYDRHPSIRYHVVAPDPVGEKGAAVVRLETVVGTSASVARIVDFFPAPEHGCSLLVALASFAADHGCLLMDYFTTSPERARALGEMARSGGMEPLDTPRLPFMFQPPAWGVRNSINLVRAVGGLAKGGVQLDAFHATKADSNQDVERTAASAPQLAERSAGT